jgi:hypothetical protein
MGYHLNKMFARMCKGFDIWRCGTTIMRLSKHSPIHGQSLPEAEILACKSELAEDLSMTVNMFREIAF